MKRSGFRVNVYKSAPTPPATRGRGGRIVQIVSPSRSIEKENAVVCEAYREVVRQLPCMHCGVSFFTQFCHTDQGKGLALKTDDRQGWPGCGPHGDEPGCHWLIGTSGRVPREVRRELEIEYSKRTRECVKILGLWPRGLPDWPGDTT